MVRKLNEEKQQQISEALKGLNSIEVEAFIKQQKHENAIKDHKLKWQKQGVIAVETKEAAMFLTAELKWNAANKSDQNWTVRKIQDVLIKEKLLTPLNPIKTKKNKEDKGEKREQYLFDQTDLERLIDFFKLNRTQLFHLFDEGYTKHLAIEHEKARLEMVVQDQTDEIEKLKKEIEKLKRAAISKKTTSGASAPRKPQSTK